MPVLLGEANARRVAQALMVAFYPIVVGAALAGWNAFLPVHPPWA